MLRRLINFILVLGLAAALFVAAYPQALDLNRDDYIAQLIAFRGALVVAGVVAAVVFLFIAVIIRPLRRFFVSGALLLLVFSLVNSAILFERGPGSVAFAPKAAGSLTVLSWNTRGAAPGAAEIARLAVANHADVLSLPETPKAAADQIAAAMSKTGRPMQVFSLTTDAEDTSKSTSLLIATALGSYTMQAEATTTTVVPTIIARPAKPKSPVIVAVHASSPVAPSLDAWRRDLGQLAKLCTGDTMIMAGDFNATLDHLAGLGTKSAALGSCRDSALTAGAGALGTWPTRLPALLGTPIDHVLTTLDWRVTGMRVVTSEDTAGSDHRPLLVQLSPRSQ